MAGRNGHRLRRLKNRLTKHQLKARRERMKKHGTWRQTMIDNLNEIHGKISKVVNGNQDRNDARQRLNYGLFAFAYIVLAALVARALGWL